MKNKFLTKILTASLAMVMSASFILPTTTAMAVTNEKSTSTLMQSSPIPSKVLVGYWHNFDNGTGTIKLRDVSPDWDVINLSFGEGTSVTSGDIRFKPINATDDEFREDVKYLQSQGKKVLISIGGEKGQVRLETTEARDKFISSVCNIIDTYGLDGLDIDFEGHSLKFDAGDKDFKNPTTPVIVNLIYALKTITAKYGKDFVLTMAPETFFVQMGGTFYGGLNSNVDARCAAYLPVIHALRDELDWLQVQYYNSGPINDINGKSQNMGSPEFYVALADMLLTGFPIMGDKNNIFPALRPDQVVLGVPAASGAGNGWVNNDGVKQAMDALMNGGTVGGYTIKEGYPDLRGLMTWSINWDKLNNYSWSKYFREYFDSIVPPTPVLKEAKLSSTAVSKDGAYSLSINVPAKNLATSYELFENGVSIDKGSLQAEMTSSQIIKKDFTNKGYGTYAYTVVVKDAAGNTATSKECLVEIVDPSDDPNKEDVNNDGVFDVLDLSEIATRYNAMSGQSNYSIKYDLTKDGIIDLFDLVKVAKKIGQPITPIIDEWKSGTSYVIGDKVTYKGKTYLCTYAHVSHEGWLPGNVPTLWQEVK
ncbi:MAG: glycosyl hydrolase family 18 protein [Clostridium sp.]